MLCQIQGLSLIHICKEYVDKIAATLILQGYLDLQQRKAKEAV